MATWTLGSFARLVRLDTSAFVFFAVLIAVVVRSGTLHAALMAAAPLVPICFCGFVLNNIYDVERDRRNHPHRPLPRGQIDSHIAGLLFFIFLTLALAAIKTLVPLANVIPYGFLLILLLAYNVAVERFPIAKNIIVGLGALAPLLIILSVQSARREEVAAIMLATFLFVVSIEMFSDILDAKGDGATVVKLVGLANGARIAFGLKAVSDIALVAAAATAPQIWAVCAVIITDLALVVAWYAFSIRKALIYALKIQIVSGLIFLV